MEVAAGGLLGVGLLDFVENSLVSMRCDSDSEVSPQHGGTAIPASSRGRLMSPSLANASARILKDSLALHGGQTGVLQTGALADQTIERRCLGLARRKTDNLQSLR
jgi:hypothetical protein